jgi:hypothetical protein
LVIGFDLVDPIVAHILGAVLAKPNVDEKVGVVLAGAEVRGRLIAAEFLVDTLSEQCWGLPAP